MLPRSLQDSLQAYFKPLQTTLCPTLSPLFLFKDKIIFRNCGAISQLVLIHAGSEIHLQDWLQYSICNIVTIKLLKPSLIFVSMGRTYTSGEVEIPVVFQQLSRKALSVVCQAESWSLKHGHKIHVAKKLWAGNTN